VTVDPEKEHPIVTSILWGKDGELWDPNAGVLHDYTNVGYMLSNEPIPDNWPVFASVTDYGATPDDTISDVAAFRLAMERCPPKHIIKVPNGRYFIDEPLPFTKNDILLQGESRDGTILFFPKHMSEIEQKDFSNTPFITLSGGHNRGIENLSLIFRDEQKGTGYYKPDGRGGSHWYFQGEVPIRFGGSETNSWMRNIYIKNANHAIRVTDRGTKQISIINIVLDQFMDRVDPGAGSVGHMGIKVGNDADRILVHNVLMTGKWNHELDISGTEHSVFSRIRGRNVFLDHHAMGNAFNLFTEVDTGIGGRGYGGPMNQSRETYWGIKGIKEASYLPESSKSTFVGINTQAETSIGADWHHETLDPDALVPANMYLAQMNKKPNKYIPEDVELTLPPIKTDRVLHILPVDDTYITTSAKANYGTEWRMRLKQYQSEGFLKFDLSDIGTSRVAAAKLKMHVSGAACIPCGLEVYSVLEDAWDEESLTAANVPTAGALVTSQYLYTSNEPTWVEFDITSHVNTLLTSDGIVSLRLAFGGSLHFRDSRMSISTKEGSSPLRLVVHLDPSTVAPPATPKGLKVTNGYNGIKLQWEKNTESDFASYAVYRLEESGYFFRKAMGLVTPEYTDYSAKPDETHTYFVTAQDIADSESLMQSQGVTGKLCNDINCRNGQ
jgi:hypothetical protein